MAFLNANRFLLEHTPYEQIPLKALFPSTFLLFLKEQIIRIIRSDLEANVLKGWVTTRGEEAPLLHSKTLGIHRKLKPMYNFATPRSRDSSLNGTWSLNLQKITKIGVKDEERGKTGQGVHDAPHTQLEAPPTLAAGSQRNSQN